MLRALCLMMTVLVVPSGHASADDPPDLGANAALRYWQGFASLPKLSKDEESQLNAECLTMPLDARAHRLALESTYALRMMHYGAALPRCAWGIVEEEGIEAHLPHAQAARVMSSLACLRARIHLEEGRKAEAVDDLVAATILGRQVSRDGILIAMLIGDAIERRTGDMIALILPELDAGTIRGLKARLDALPPGGRLAAAMKLEERFIVDWLVRKIKGAKDREALLTFLGQISNMSQPRERTSSPMERGRDFLDHCGGTVDGALKMAEELRTGFALMAPKLELPPEQLVKEFDREMRERSANPFFTLFPGLDMVRMAQARADARRALLSAAIAVQLEGRAALEDHPDPIIGGPFEYAPFEGGFELRTRWKRDDQRPAKSQLEDGRPVDPRRPVVLAVGRRGK